MSNTTRTLCSVAITLSALTLGVNAFAQNEPKPIDLNEFLCKDVMRLTGEDRAIAIGVLHGYALGKKGATIYVAGALGNVSDAFTEYCLDHPSSKALDSFLQIAK